MLEEGLLVDVFDDVLNLETCEIVGLVRATKDVLQVRVIVNGRI